MNTLVSVALLLVGILVLVGEFTLGFLLPWLGVILVVLGVLMLLGILSGGTLVGTVTVVLGLLLYAGVIGVPGLIERAINLIVGVALVVVAIGRLT